MLHKINTFVRSPTNIKQLLTFALVGASGTLAHYATLLYCVENLGTSAVMGTCVGALAGAIVNYILNYYVTFKAKGKHLKTAGKFISIAAIGMGINALVVYLLAQPSRLHYIPAQLIATATVLIITYAGNRLWTFSPNREA